MQNIVKHQGECKRAWEGLTWSFSSKSFHLKRRCQSLLQETINHCKKKYKAENKISGMSQGNKEKDLSNFIYIILIIDIWFIYQKLHTKVIIDIFSNSHAVILGFPGAKIWTECWST